MYRKLFNIKEANIKKTKSNTKPEINSFYKKEISEGIYEIKEPYQEKEKKIKKITNNEKTIVTGFDDFFKSNEEVSSELTEKEKIDQILGINKPKTQKIVKPSKNLNKLKYPINSVKKAKKKPIKEEIKEKSPEPKLSLFKQRMLAKRKAKNSK